MLRMYVERGLREFRRKQDPQILAKEMLFGFAVALVKAAQETSPPDGAALAAAGHYFLARHHALASDDPTNFDFAVLIFSLVALQDPGKVPAEVVPHLRADAPDPFSILERAAAGPLASPLQPVAPAPGPDAEAAAERGVALVREAERTGDRAVLEQAIAELETSVRLFAGRPARQAGQLNNLSYALSARFDRSGNLAHLDEAIAVVRRSIELFPPADHSRGVALNGLGAMLLKRYQHGGDPRDLDTGIDTLRAARDTIDPGSFCALPNQLNLGTALTKLFERDRNLSDLDESIAMLRDALAQLPEGSAERAGGQINLGIALRKRSEMHFGNPAGDLSEAIALLRAALAGLGPTSPLRPTAAIDLSSMLRTRFRTGDYPQDAAEAMRVLDEAMAVLQPTDHWYTILAVELSDAAALLDEGPGSLGAGVPGAAGPGTAGDLRARVREAIPDRPPSPGSLIPWAYANADAGRAADSIRELKKAAFSATESISGQIDAAIAWARIATPTDPAEALTGYQTVLARLPELGGGRLDDQSRLSVFGSFNGVPSEAAALAVELGDVAGAVEYLEHGRLLWWSLVGAPVPAAPDRPRLRDLHAAAAGGPVIMLNAGSRRGDALILTGDDLVAVPLALPPVTEMRDRAAEFAAFASEPEPDEVMRETLRWMTREVTAPVLDHLRASGAVRGARAGDGPGPGERAWWCPASMLSGLPWHATALDDLVSSYTPNLRALASARRARQHAPGPASPRVLAVGISDAPGLDRLPNAAAEAAEVATYFAGEPTVLLDDAATRASVLAELPRASWLHLACHARQSFFSPMDGGIALADGEVTVATLMGTAVEAGQLAFLNACETSQVTPGTTDELITVAMAVHLAGYPGVIATGWPVRDEVALDVARSVYHAVTAGGRPDGSRAAPALNQASRRLRRRFPAYPSMWAPFHHLGW